METLPLSGCARSHSAETKISSIDGDGFSAGPFFFGFIPGQSGRFIEQYKLPLPSLGVHGKGEPIPKGLSSPSSRCGFLSISLSPALALPPPGKSGFDAFLIEPVRLPCPRLEEAPSIRQRSGIFSTE